MFTALELVQPTTVEAAYSTLLHRKNNAILGGCGFLRLGSQKIGTAIDLSNLNMNYIHDQDEYLEIGAMTTLRSLETHPACIALFGGILPLAVSHIIGVQFRNVVTVGGSVFAKYGFSDVITALLAVDADVELYHGGRMSLEMFLEKPYEKDILTKVIVPKRGQQAAYQHLRNSASDFPIVNVAVAKLNEQWRIVIGARPSRAAVAYKASEQLSNSKLRESDIEQSARLAVEELSFGTNIRGTAAYRKAVGVALVKRAITEVLQCK